VHHVAALEDFADHNALDKVIYTYRARVGTELDKLLLEAALLCYLV
jgi:hypothetical protein